MATRLQLLYFTQTFFFHGVYKVDLEQSPSLFDAVFFLKEESAILTKRRRYLISSVKRTHPTLPWQQGQLLPEKAVEWNNDTIVAQNFSGNSDLHFDPLHNSTTQVCRRL